MNERAGLAVSTLRALGFQNVTAQYEESYRARYMARHDGKEPPAQPRQVWHWHGDGRFVQVIVNTETGVCITSLDVPGVCLGDVLRAARAGDNV